MSVLALQLYINRFFIYGLKVSDHFQCYSTVDWCRAIPCFVIRVAVARHLNVGVGVGLM